DVPLSQPQAKPANLKPSPQNSPSGSTDEIVLLDPTNKSYLKINGIYPRLLNVLKKPIRELPWK
ncbi:MAG: hypothetical protein ACPL7A_02940, partial [Anaerolineales bacterium]